MFSGISNTDLIVIFGLILISSELFLGVQTGFDFVLIGSILVVSGIIGSFTGSLSVSLVLSVILSVVYIFFGRNAIKQKITVMTHKTNIDKLVGSTGVVVRSLTPETPGLVRLEDEDWRATSDEVLFEKDKIEVVSLSGVTLKVKKSVTK